MIKFSASFKICRLLSLYELFLTKSWYIYILFNVELREVFKFCVNSIIFYLTFLYYWLFQILNYLIHLSLNHLLNKIIRLQFVVYILVLGLFPINWGTINKNSISNKLAISVIFSFYTSPIFNLFIFPRSNS